MAEGDRADDNGSGSVERWVGRLEGGLAAVTSGQEGIKTSIDALTRSHHETNHAIRDEIGAMNGRLIRAEASVQNMEPEVRRLAHLRSFAGGVLFACSAASAIIGSAVSILWRSFIG